MKNSEVVQEHIAEEDFSREELVSLLASHLDTVELLVSGLSDAEKLSEIGGISLRALDKTFQILQVTLDWIASQEGDEL